MLKTEMRNPRTTHIDKMTTLDMVSVVTEEFYEAVRAVEREKENIAQAVDIIAASIAAGHRLFFIGAGTSGRLGVLDAAECPPTFGVPPTLVNGIIAGGRNCMFAASENAEDGDDIVLRFVETEGKDGRYSINLFGQNICGNIGHNEIKTLKISNEITEINLIEW